jgi:L-asparaginase II
MAQQEAIKYKEPCQEILNTTMQEMRKFKEKDDQLLHEHCNRPTNARRCVPTCYARTMPYCKK